MKLRTLLMAGLTVATLTLPSAALSLNVDGLDRTVEAKATLIENTTYVSLRSVVSMLDPSTQVAWENGAASVTTEKLVLTARPGDGYFRVNGQLVYIGSEVKLINGSTMVPIRALASAMGGTVDWEQSTETAILTTGTGTQEPTSYSYDDLYWLSRIISAESRGEPLEGKIAVGTVVLNRVVSDEFPNTIKEVIFDSRWGGQFEPVRNGTIYNEPTEESVQAAKMCLEGARAAGNSLYFLAPDLTSNHWIMENRIYVTTIGCHWFYQ